MFYNHLRSTFVSSSNIHLAVQAQDVLEYPWGPVKVELPPLQRVRVAQAEYLRCNISYHITDIGKCRRLHCVTNTKYIELTR